MGRILITLGILITLIGILIFILESHKIFPLPGDIYIKKENFTLYIPITSAILLSILITLIINLFF